MPPLPRLAAVAALALIGCATSSSPAPAPTPKKQPAPFEPLQTRAILSSAISDGQGHHSAHHSGYAQTGSLALGANNLVRLDLTLARTSHTVLCPTDKEFRNSRQACVDNPAPVKPTPPIRITMWGLASPTDSGLTLGLEYRLTGVKYKTGLRCTRDSVGIEGVELDCQIDGQWPKRGAGYATLRFGPATPAK